MFNWIYKTCMTETLFDNICETICIVMVLYLIYWIAKHIENLEERWKDERK